MRQTIASVLVVFMALFMFSGCGKRTLESKIKPAELQKMVDEMKENSLFKSVYKDASIEIKENSIIYKYYYKQSMTEEQIEAVKAQLEKSGLDKQIDSLKSSFKKSTGIEPDSVAFIYYSGDDVEIARIEK